MMYDAWQSFSEAKCHFLKDDYTNLLCGLNQVSRDLIFLFVFSLSFLLLFLILFFILNFRYFWFLSVYITFRNGPMSDEPMSKWRYMSKSVARRSSYQSFTHVGVRALRLWSLWFFTTLWCSSRSLTINTTSGHV